MFVGGLLPRRRRRLAASVAVVAEIAFMFNLSPEDLSASLTSSVANMTYANLDQKTRDRLLYSMQPIMVRFEQTFGDILPGSQTARFTTEEMMRSAEQGVRSAEASRVLRNGSPVSRNGSLVSLVL